ncbi:MAG: cytochrome c [Deinococcota bacterium]|nr:cytochrome c [Deinococcota bacterium]
MRKALILLAGGLALTGVGCGPAYRGEPILGALDISEPQVALGQRVFYANCQQCHPGGAGGLGFALNNKPLTSGMIKFQVRNGIGAMPSFSAERIGDEELDALVVYLARLREHGSEAASQ